MNIFIYIISGIAILIALFILWSLVRSWLSAHLAIQEFSMALRQQDQEILNLRNALYRRTGNYEKKKKKKTEFEDGDDESDDGIAYDENFAQSLTPDEREQYVRMVKGGKYKNDED